MQSEEDWSHDPEVAPKMVEAIVALAGWHADAEEIARASKIPPDQIQRILDRHADRITAFQDKFRDEQEEGLRKQRAEAAIADVSPPARGASSASRKPHPGTSTNRSESGSRMQPQKDWSRTQELAPKVIEAIVALAGWHADAEMIARASRIDQDRIQRILDYHADRIMAAQAKFRVKQEKALRKQRAEALRAKNHINPRRH